MKTQDIKENFLSYFEGTLSETDKVDFENELNASEEIKRDFQEFAITFNVLNSMNKQDVKAPEGFDLEVMKAIDELSLVNNRSSIMTTIMRFVGKGLLSIAAAFSFILILTYTITRLNLELTIGQSLQLIEGSFGAAVMIAAMIMAIMTLALPKNFKRKVFIPLAPTFAAIAVITFMSRSMVSLFFGTDYSNENEVEVSQAPLDSSSSIVYNDTRVGNVYNQPIFQKKKEDTGLQASVTDSSKGVDKLLANSNNVSAPASSLEHKMQVAKPIRREEIYSDDLIAYEPVAEVINTEQYNSTTDNSFQIARSAPLSTFSIDVDTASYSNIRRFLNQNQLPPKDSVRIEEMLNYFKYDYNSPNNKETPFTVSTELSKAPWFEKHQLLHIGLKGYQEDVTKLPASNLVFLIDVSGSMESPEKLPLLKQGLKLLVEQLRAQDRVAMVVYAGAAGVVLDSKEGSQKQEIFSAIENLQAGGSTAGGAGIELAYKIAKSHFIENGNNRIVLATDGDFNVGVSSDEELVKLIEEKRKTGIYLSILGFGMGNYKDGKMEQLANKGNGNYAYIDNIHEAKKVLVNDFRSTIFAIAKDVKIQIEFNPAYVQAYRLIGYENRMLNKEDFNDDRKDAGELGAGHSVTALYEIVPTGVEFNQTPSVDALKYQVVASPTPEIKPALNLNQELATIKLRYKLPNEEQSKLITQIVSSNPSDNTSDNFRFAAAVSEFGMILRDSQYKGNSSLEASLNLAQSAKGIDSLGYRAELIKLIETAQLLKK